MERTAQTVAILAAHVAAEHLNAGDIRFARSLVTQYPRRGLSEAQWVWVERLIQRADGTQVASTLTTTEADQQALGVLRDALLHNRVRARDREFAKSLVKTYDLRGGLSASQWLWVKRIGESATPVAVAAAQGLPAAAAPSPAQLGDMVRNAPASSNVVGDLSQVIQWLTNASSALSRPMLRMPSSIGRVDITKPGQASQYYGQNVLIIKCSREFLGRWQDNVFYPAVMLRRNPARVLEVLRVLRALADSPLQYAASEGRRTGVCCFCARTLTDERSTSVGYGPICAGHHMLPWGNQTRRAHRNHTPRVGDEAIRAASRGHVIDTSPEALARMNSGEE